MKPSKLLSSLFATAALLLPLSAPATPYSSSDSNSSSVELATGTNTSSGGNSATGPVGNPNQPLSFTGNTQEIFTVPSGKLPADAVNVSTSGTLGRATVVVTLDLSRVLANSFSAGYNVYVAAVVPGIRFGTAQPVWFMKQPSSAWDVLTLPIAAFMANVAAGSVDQRIVVTIAADADLTKHIGTEFYIGYGLSSEEMISSQRFRGIYKVN